MSAPGSVSILPLNPYLPPPPPKPRSHSTALPPLPPHPPAQVQAAADLKSVAHVAKEVSAEYLQRIQHERERADAQLGALRDQQRYALVCTQFYSFTLCTLSLFALFHIELTCGSYDWPHTPSLSHCTRRTLGCHLHFAHTLATVLISHRILSHLEYRLPPLYHHPAPSPRRSSGTSPRWRPSSER